MSDEHEDSTESAEPGPSAEPAVAQEDARTGSPPADDMPPPEAGPDPDQGKSGPAATHPAAPPDSDDWVPDVVLDTWPAYGAATLTGLLMPVAFAGGDVWPLTFITWAPLIFALRGQTPRRAAGLGWWAGFVQVGVGFYWLTGMLQTFSGFPTPLCVLFAAILSAYQGGRIGLCGWLYARAATRGWHPGLSFAGAFALSELCYPLLFPWYLGGCFHNAPILLQTADLGGPILVSLVAIAPNLAVAELLRRWQHGQQADRRTVVAGLATVVLALGYGAVRMSQVDAVIATSPKVMIGLVQADIGLHDRRRALSDSLALTAQLRAQGAELVVWSEAAIPRAYDVKRYQRELRDTVTHQLGVPAVVGGILYRRLEGRGPKGRKLELMNSAFMADATGTITSRYDKQFLLMFGEYLPLGDVFPILYEWSPNSGGFSPGTSYEPLVYGEHRLAAMICYEDIIPSFVNKLVETGKPDLLVNLTNDRWFGDSTEPWQHLALAKLRSVEHHIYLARVSNSGVSALIDANGRVVVHGGTFRKEALLGEGRFMRMATVYARVGNLPWWIVGAATVAAAFVRRKRRAPRAEAVAG